jgi:hypothetical protein
MNIDNMLGDNGRQTYIGKHGLASHESQIDEEMGEEERQALPWLTVDDRRSTTDRSNFNFGRGNSE